MTGFGQQIYGVGTTALPTVLKPMARNKGNVWYANFAYPK